MCKVCIPGPRYGAYDTYIRPLIFCKCLSFNQICFLPSQNILSCLWIKPSARLPLKIRLKVQRVILTVGQTVLICKACMSHVFFITVRQILP